MLKGQKWEQEVYGFASSLLTRITAIKVKQKKAEPINTQRPLGMKVKIEPLTGDGVSDAAGEKDSTCDSIKRIVLRREIGWGWGEPVTDSYKMP